MYARYHLGKREEWPGFVLRGEFCVTSDELLAHVGRWLIKLAMPWLFRMDIVRQSPLPPGPKIIAPNHPSTTDPFLILPLVREPMSILIDERLFKVPIFGQVLTQSGHIPVVPGKGRAAYETALRLLESGRNIGIFPEGAISPLRGGFHRPCTGAARLALNTGAPIIPVGISLKRERIRLIETEIDGETTVGTWYLNGPYAMTVGEPLYLQGDIEDHAYVREASSYLMQCIVGLAYDSAKRMNTDCANAGYIGLPQVHMLPSPR
jgi:1-acyl-sn-glycerol-3-phosphate acyltransferase